MINIVIFNGGRGASTIIPALIKTDDIRLTSIVNAYDDGKSTGEIRSFFDMLGPSDIRKAQQLLIPTEHPDYDSLNAIFDIRFSDKLSNQKILNLIKIESSSRSNYFFNEPFSNQIVLTKLRKYLRIFLKSFSVISKSIPSKKLNLQDCSLMNCLYAGAFIQFNRNIEHASIEFEKIFQLAGSVLPTSIENKKLVGLRKNGEVLFSEAEIVELRSNVNIERVYLLESYPPKGSFKKASFADKRHFFESHHSFVQASPRTQRAIKDADIIIYSPGTQHSSLYPTYLANGIASCIAKNSRALKVFITNIGADYETPYYKAHDYIEGALRYLNLANLDEKDFKHYFNLILINENKKQKNKNYVKIDKSKLKHIEVNKIYSNFEYHNSGKHDGTLIVRTIFDEFSRHINQ